MEYDPDLADIGYIVPELIWEVDWSLPENQPEVRDFEEIRVFGGGSVRVLKSLPAAREFKATIPTIRWRKA